MKFRFKEGRSNKTSAFSGLISSIISKFNLDESFLMESIRSDWPSLAGDLISTHSIPDRLFKGILFISADHSVYANEIIMMKNSILKGLHERYSAEVVRNIKVEIRKICWNKPQKKNQNSGA